MFKVWHSLHVGDSWQVIEEGFTTSEDAQEFSETHFDNFTGSETKDCPCWLCEDGGQIHPQWWQSYICVVVEDGKEPLWVEDQVANTVGSEIETGKEVDHNPDTVRELKMYIDNESEIYFKHTLPTLRMINKHYKKGNGNIEKAVKALERYVVQVAARKYLKEFCSSSASMRSVFPKGDRLTVALDLFYDYQERRNSGDYFWEK